jgi:hypothetical protein
MLKISEKFVMDFYCRQVYPKEPTDECCMLNLAAKNWWLEATWPGWSQRYLEGDCSVGSEPMGLV